MGLGEILSRKAQEDREKVLDILESSDSTFVREEKIREQVLRSKDISAEEIVYFSKLMTYLRQEGRVVRGGATHMGTYALPSRAEEDARKHLGQIRTKLY